MLLSFPSLSVWLLNDDFNIPFHSVMGSAHSGTLLYFIFLADPLSMSPQKALETIGANLQKQYERWQPRARYKQSLDPTVEEVKKLCTSLRRNAKEERVLFHYNGHGVPKPTSNGEVWVFNRVSIYI
jgi:hypothetical protein